MKSVQRGTTLTSKVAVVGFDNDYSESLERALGLIGGIDDLNTQERNVVIKVGVFHPRSLQHSSVGLVRSIVRSFDKAPKVFLTESDNYCGKALERLQIYRDLFTNRVVPFSLSDDTVTRRFRIANEEMGLSHVLLKPNIFVDTHVLRNFKRGSILKNLFGCTPMVKKSKYHKNEIFCKLLADIYEAVGGIDLAVADGTCFFHSGTQINVRTNMLIAGRDAVAVEAVVATVAGLKTSKLGFLQEFAKRGLGEANLENIEIVGKSPKDLERFASFRKELKALYSNRPRSPSISHTIDRLTEEGWMSKPRRVVEVVDELKRRGVSNATQAVVDTTLNRRLLKNLERMTEKDEWVYQSKRE
jgi:uncharacterized protein (DUF362 family)